MGPEQRRVFLWFQGRERFAFIVSEERMAYWDESKSGNGSL
jgi:hypothetical protein